MPTAGALLIQGAVVALRSMYSVTQDPLGIEL